jgi:hypothetical protein
MTEMSEKIREKGGEIPSAGSRMNEETCIWCGEVPANSLEHIAPDALGCPTEFVLPVGVCARCNQKNGRVDRALLTPYEIITVIKGIPRKKGKRPTVDGYSSFSSGYDGNGPVLYINREKHAVQTPDGKWLQGTNANDPIKDTKWELLPDGMVDISYKQELRFDRKAVRGLFKIAVEAIALFEGLEAARDPNLAPAKRFVMDGGGNFRAIIMPDKNPAYESYFGPCYAKEGYSRVYWMTLLGIGFACDFDPEFRGGKMLLEEIRRQSLGGQVIPNWPRRLWQENNPPVGKS